MEMATSAFFTGAAASQPVFAPMIRLASLHSALASNGGGLHYAGGCLMAWMRGLRATRTSALGAGYFLSTGAGIRMRAVTRGEQ
jgi:hypothetical protein